MTTVLTIAPLGGADMSKWCGGWASSQGEVVEVPTAADLRPDTIPDAAEELDGLIHGTLGAVTVFAHSQGAMVAGEWLENYATADPDRVKFVLTGNPERPHYGYAARKPSWVPGGNIRGLTPEGTPYRVLDIGRRKDRWANSFNGVAALLAFLPHFGHLNYSKVNPSKLDPAWLVKQVGKTEYYNVP